MTRKTTRCNPPLSLSESPAAPKGVVGFSGNTMKQKRYIGMKKSLRGKTALTREAEGGKILAQFDDMKLSYRGKSLGYGWHSFKIEEFCTID